MPVARYSGCATLNLVAMALVDAWAPSCMETTFAGPLMSAHSRCDSMYLLLSMEMQMALHPRLCLAMAHMRPTFGMHAAVAGLTSRPVIDPAKPSRSPLAQMMTAPRYGQWMARVNCTLTDPSSTPAGQVGAGSSLRGHDRM